MDDYQEELMISFVRVAIITAHSLQLIGISVATVVALLWVMEELIEVWQTHRVMGLQRKLDKRGENAEQKTL